MSIKLNLTNNESMMSCLYYGKNLDQQKENQKTNLIKYKNKQKTLLIIIHMYSYMVILMQKNVMTRKV